MIQVFEWERGDGGVPRKGEHGRRRTSVELGLGKGAGQTI